jgi:hypothetical protein
MSASAGYRSSCNAPGCFAPLMPTPRSKSPELAGQRRPNVRIRIRASIAAADKHGVGIVGRVIQIHRGWSVMAGSCECCDRRRRDGCTRKSEKEYQADHVSLLCGSFYGRSRQPDWTWRLRGVIDQVRAASWRESSVRGSTASSLSLRSSSSTAERKRRSVPLEGAWHGNSLQTSDQRRQGPAPKLR